MKIDVKQASTERAEGEVASQDDVKKFAKSLASNSKEEREKTVKNIQVWLRLREKHAGSLEELELLKLWQGLFYCLWMADKVPVQQELAGDIAKILRRLKRKETGLLFTKCFFIVLRREWGGLDKFRLDKFYSLYRYVVREGLMFSRERGCMEQYLTILREEVLEHKPDGLRLHLCDIFLDEVASSGCKDALNSEELHDLFSPFYITLGQTDSMLLASHILKVVFLPLLVEETSLPNLSLKDVGQSLFSIGADVVSRSKIRKAVYAAHAQFKKASSQSSAAGEQLLSVTKVSKPDKDTLASPAGRNLKKDFDKMTDTSPGQAQNKTKKTEQPQQVLDTPAVSSTSKEKKKKKKSKKTSTPTAMDVAEVTPESKETKKTTKSKKTSTPEAMELADVTPEGKEKKNKTKSKKTSTPEAMELEVTPESKKSQGDLAQKEAEETVEMSDKKKKNKKKRKSTDSMGSEEGKSEEEANGVKAKKLRFSLKKSQILEHVVSVKRLRTTPVKPAAKVASPETSALKKSALKEKKKKKAAEPDSSAKKLDGVSLNKRIAIAEQTALKNQKLFTGGSARRRSQPEDFF